MPPHGKTDREISAELRHGLKQQAAVIRSLSTHAPLRYIREMLERTATQLECAESCWHEEEDLAGGPLWR